MKRIMLELTEEAAAAVNAAAAGRPLNPAVEAWIWRITEVKAAARRLGIKKPTRRRPGRPPVKATDAK